MNIKSYSELVLLPTFEDRFEYLRLDGIVGETTFGFDRYMNRQFGNPDFIRNAVLYLTDEEGWLELRSRTLRLRLLNKNIVTEQRLFWQIINVATPVVLVLIAGLIYHRRRKRIYGRQ